jgi:hypothetical protein
LEPPGEFCILYLYNRTSTKNYTVPVDRSQPHGALWALHFFLEMQVCKAKANPAIPATAL